MVRLVMLVAVVAAAFGVQAFSYEEARSLYVKNYTESPPSVQECGDYVFVIQEGKIDYDDPSGIKAAVLRGQLDAIEKYVGKSAGGVDSPFSKSLTEKLLPLVSFRIPVCKSCRVDELQLVGKFRHVSAFEAAPLREARTQAASGRPANLSNGEWGELIAKKIKSCDNEDAKDELWAELGAAPVLVSRLGGVRWMVDRADGIALCEATAGWRPEATAKECNSILRLNPAFPQAYVRLAALAEGEGDLIVALSRQFKGALSAPRQEAVSAVATRIAERSASSAWTEYARLYARVLKESVDSQGRAEISRLDRRLAALAIIGQISPLIGLLGTIIGFIKTVLLVNSQELVARADLLNSSMEALLSAALGLGVAIPVAVMYGVLRVRMERIVVEMEAAASQITGYIATREAKK